MSRFQYQFSSVTQLCPTLCDPMDCSTPGFPTGMFLSAVMIQACASSSPAFWMMYSSKEISVQTLYKQVHTISQTSYNVQMEKSQILSNSFQVLKKNKTKQEKPQCNCRTAGRNKTYYYSIPRRKIPVWLSSAPASPLSSVQTGVERSSDQWWFMYGSQLDMYKDDDTLIYMILRNSWLKQTIEFFFFFIMWRR